MAHFGFGDATTVDTLVVHWPAGNRQILTDISVNQRLEISEVINVGIEEPISLPAPFSFDIFPNPVSDTASARIKLHSPETGQGRVFIYNTLGQEVFRKTVGFNPGNSELILDTYQFAPGVYYIIVQLDSQRTSKMMVVF